MQCDTLNRAPALTPEQLVALPELPRDEEGPVFKAPWEAQAFAMAVMLQERGAFTWPEWVQTFSQTVREAQAAGDPDLGDTYYRHWLATLERLVEAKRIVTRDVLAQRAEAWREAARRTPHGQPIELGRTGEAG